MRSALVLKLLDLILNLFFMVSNQIIILLRAQQSIILWFLLRMTTWRKLRMYWLRPMILRQLLLTIGRHRSSKSRYITIVWELLWHWIVLVIFLVIYPNWSVVTDLGWH